MVPLVPLYFFWVDWPFSDSKGSPFVLQPSLLLKRYHSFHLVRLDILVEAPYFDSIFVLFCAQIKLVIDMYQKSDGSYVASSPCRSLMYFITLCRVSFSYSLVISGFQAFHSSALYFRTSLCWLTGGSIA